MSDTTDRQTDGRVDADGPSQIFPKYWSVLWVDDFGPTSDVPTLPFDSHVTESLKKHKQESTNRIRIRVAI